MTFVEYLTKVRMDKAKQLLRTTGTKTTEIAFEVGFRMHIISVTCLKDTGCTPREYRNRSDRPEQEQENYERKKKFSLKNRLYLLLLICVIPLTVMITYLLFL